MKKTKLLYLVLVVMIFGVAGCSTDDDPTIEEQPKTEEPDEEDPVDIDDPDAASESVTFKNGTPTKVEESFPEPSNDDSAPELFEEDHDEIAIAGTIISIPLHASAPFKGVYFQVKGTDYYYDITLDPADENARLSNKKSRLGHTLRTKDEGSYLLIETNSNLQSGSLCIKYAVYDENGRVSNAIEKCISIKAPGGENSSFLTANIWTLESQEYFGTTYNGHPYEEIIIAGQTYISSTPVWCPNVEEGVEFQEEYALVFADLTLQANGQSELIFSESFKSINSDLYCETGKEEYETEIDGDKELGHWSYDDSKKELTLITQYEEYGETYHDVTIYKITYEGGKLILLNEVHEGNISAKLTFTPKK